MKFDLKKLSSHSLGGFIVGLGFAFIIRAGVAGTFITDDDFNRGCTLVLFGFLSQKAYEVKVLRERHNDSVGISSRSEHIKGFFFGLLLAFAVVALLP
ncbi:MAG: hypothetical protein EOP04_00115 [Proteobacteria bacterium]|nr:MAG: hypothetical protein EOP04_00115 [Pseudomonadota bacterium]